jgi:hypothetical protein
MARVQHVKAAQQRYATKPVIDPATGEQKRTPVIDSKTGEQKRSKRGPQWHKVTERDIDNPLPMPTCDYSGCKIAADREGDTTIRVGDAYKYIDVKTGTYTSRKYTRHEKCPTWNVWEYSSSLSARIAQIESEGADAIASAAMQAEEDDDSGVTEAIEEIASNIEGLAEEKRDAASNIEDGFGTATQQSDELNEQAESLDTWAQEVRDLDLPSIEDHDCDHCAGSGEVECSDCSGMGNIDDGDGGEEPCDTCNTSGEVECEHCDGTGHDIEAYREALAEIELPDCPI